MPTDEVTMQLIDMHSSLLGLSLEFRLALFAVVHALVFYWTRYVVAPERPGMPRIIRAMALEPVIALGALLFDPTKARESSLVLYAACNLVWIMNSRIWSFCWNRGGLVKSYDVRDNRAFALSLLTMVSVAFEEKPIEKTKDYYNNNRLYAYKDVRFSVVHIHGAKMMEQVLSIVRRIIFKAMCVYAIVFAYRRIDDERLMFLRSVCLSFFLYLCTSSLEDITALLVLLFWRIKAKTSFDCPWKAQSIAELWSKRYNLSFGDVLRDFAYDPICQGRLIAGQHYFERLKISKFRKMIALFVTFACSGAFHALFAFYGFPMDFPIRQVYFFLIQGACIIVETIIKQLISRTRYDAIVAKSIPSIAFNVYTCFIGLYYVHLYFWPDVVNCGAADLMMQGVTGI